LELFSLMGAIKHVSCMCVCVSDCVLTWSAGWKHHTSPLEITHEKSKQPQMTSRSLTLSLNSFSIS